MPPKTEPEKKEEVGLLRMILELIYSGVKFTSFIFIALVTMMYFI